MQTSTPPQCKRAPQYKTEGIPIPPSEEKERSKDDDSLGSSSSSRSHEEGSQGESPENPAIVAAVEAMRPFTSNPEGWVLKTLKRIEGATPEIIVAASKVRIPGTVKSRLQYIAGAVQNKVDEPPPKPAPKLASTPDKVKWDRAGKLVDTMRELGFDFVPGHAPGYWTQIRTRAPKDGESQEGKLYEEIRDLMPWVRGQLDQERKELGDEWELPVAWVNPNGQSFKDWRKMVKEQAETPET